jgi:hypothetical protein
MEEIQSFKDFRLWSLNRSKFCAAVKVLLPREKYEDPKVREAAMAKVSKLFSTREIQSYVEISALDGKEEEEKMLKSA